MQAVHFRLAKIFRGLKNNSSGVTLVEVMFVSVIGVMVMGMVMILYVGVNNSMVVGVALAEINSDARLAVDRIVRDVRWATELETTRTISSTTYQTANDELIIQVPSIDSSGDIISSTYDYIVYALDSSDATRLRRIVDPDASSNRASMNQVVAKNISSFSLSSGGTGLSSVGSLSSVDAIEVTVAVNKEPIEGKTVTQSLSSEVEIRND